MTVNRARAFDIFLPILLFSVSLILRLKVTPELGLRPDEYIYWSRGIYTLGFNWQWSPEFMWDQPPLLMYLTSFTILLFNSALSTVRMIPVLAGSILVVVQYFLGKAFFDRRVGLLSAIFLAFNGFHILYSRTLMIESLVLLLLEISLYFFWTGIITGNSIVKALIGGIFLGLALDAKYTSLLAYPAFLLFFILAKKEWKVKILGKEFLIYVLASVATFLPVLLALAIGGVNPFFWQISGRFGSQFSLFGNAAGKIGDFIIRGLQNYGSIVNYVSPLKMSSQEAVFPGYTVLLNVSIVLAVLVGLYFLVFFFKRRREESMLMILFVTFGVFFAVYPVKFQYYWLYTFIAFPTMIAALIFVLIDFGRSVRGSTRKYQMIATASVLILASIVFTSTMIGGVISSQTSSGANDELIPAIKYIQNHNGAGSLVGAGTYAPFNEMISFYLSLYNINATVIRFDKFNLRVEPASKQILESPFKTEGLLEQVVSLDAVHQYHPRFIIENRLFYETKYTSAMKKELAESYRVAFDGELIFLFESNNSTAQSPSQVQTTMNKSAVYVDELVFRHTVPSKALLGVSYQPNVVVQNVIEEDVDVTISLKSSMQYFLYRPERISLHLKPGERQFVDFMLIGHRESTKPLDISLFIDATTSDGLSNTQKVVEQTIVIKQDLTMYYILFIIMISLAVIGICVFYRRRRKSIERVFR